METEKRLRFRARDTNKQKGRQRENARANNRNIGKTTTNILQSMLTKLSLTNWTNLSGNR